VVSHHEFVVALSESTSDQTYSFNINPGNTAIFPWLSAIAPSWDKYRFKRLSFSYSPNSSVTTPGLIVFAFDYDPRDADYTSLTEFENCHSHVETAPYTKMSLSFDFSKYLGRWFKTTSTTRTESKDWYYPGKFQVFVLTGPATTAYGRVLVDYEVEFCEEQVVDQDSFDFSSADDLEVTGGDGILAKYSDATPRATNFGTSFEFVGTELVCKRGGRYLCEFQGSSADTNSTVVTYSGDGTAYYTPYAAPALVAPTAITWGLELILSEGDVVEFDSSTTVTYTAITLLLTPFYRY
jgi:hypothetical protein